MTDERPDRDSGVTMGPVVVEGEAPWYAAWLYLVPMTVGALWMGLAGPFSGWRAVLASLVTAIVVYVVVAAVVTGSGLVRAAVSSRRHRREFERDPQAFMENHWPRRPGPGSHGSTE